MKNPLSFLTALLISLVLIAPYFLLFLYPEFYSHLWILPLVLFAEMLGGIGLFILFSLFWKTTSIIFENKHVQLTTHVISMFLGSFFILMVLVADIRELWFDVVFLLLGGILIIYGFKYFRKPQKKQEETIKKPSKIRRL